MGIFDFLNADRNEFNRLYKEINNLSETLINKMNLNKDKALKLLKQKELPTTTSEQKKYIDDFARFVIEFNKNVDKDVNYLLNKLDSTKNLTQKIIIQNSIIDKYNYYLNLEFQALSLDNIDNMDGQEFEKYLIDKILPAIGYYNIEGTSYTGDYGVDIIAYKNGIKCAIQCKRFSNKVSNRAIQEVVAGRKHYKCEKAIVITNNYYTRNAKELAFDNQVELLDRDDLILVIKNINTNNL